MITKEKDNESDKLKDFESVNAALKKQMIDIIQDSNQIQNGLQNQLQGAQLVS